jgi:hypothetical protein
MDHPAGGGMSDADLIALRDNLTMLKAYVGHWEDDFDCGLRPTASTVTNARTLISDSLALINRENRNWHQNAVMGARL